MNKLGQLKGTLLQSVKEKQIPVPRSEKKKTRLGNEPMSLSLLGEMWPIIIPEL